MNFAGIDIGGANIKFAIVDGPQIEIPFPIWQNPNRLHVELAKLNQSLVDSTCLGVTMTAELADCFESKPAGVRFIVDAVERAFAARQPMYYRTDGMMCDAPLAVDQWESVAASNWHALAWYACFKSGMDSGFVFDIGSTTTDIIPVESGMPVIGLQNDFDRLSNGQLVYAGIGRTPICSLLDQVRFGDSRVGIAREFFATTQDVFIWRGELPESESLHTADGQPATKGNARRRLARMVCADSDELSDAQVDAIAEQTRQQLVLRLTEAFQSVVGKFQNLPPNFVTFGGGAWLAKEIVESEYRDAKSGGFPRVVSFRSDALGNQTAAALAVAQKRQTMFADSETSHVR